MSLQESADIIVVPNDVEKQQIVPTREDQTLLQAMPTFVQAMAERAYASTSMRVNFSE